MSVGEKRRKEGKKHLVLQLVRLPGTLYVNERIQIAHPTISTRPEPVNTTKAWSCSLSGESIPFPVVYPLHALAMAIQSSQLISEPIGLILFRNERYLLIPRLNVIQR